MWREMTSHWPDYDAISADGPRDPGRRAGARLTRATGSNRRIVQFSRTASPRRGRASRARCRRRAPRRRRARRRAGRRAGSRAAAARASPSSRSRHARQRVRRHALGQRGLPPDAEQREPDAGAREQRHEQRERRADRERDRDRRPRQHQMKPTRIGCPAASGSRAPRRASCPPPIAADSSPNTPALPYSSSAIVGPSVVHGPNDSISATPKTATVTQIHARERTSRVALAQLGEHAPAPGASPRSRGRTRARKSAETRNVTASSANAQPAPSPSTSTVASAGPGELGDGLERAARRLRVLDQLLRHGLRHEPGVGRAEERLGGAEQRLDHDEVPDLDPAGEDQRREQRVEREADQVGRDHHPVTRQPIRPDPAEQQERDHRQRGGGQHDADVGGRADVGHIQRERDEHDLVADGAGGLTDEEVAEVSLGEDAHGAARARPRAALHAASAVDAEVAVPAVEAHEPDDRAVIGHDREPVGLLGVEQLDRARDRVAGGDEIVAVAGERLQRLARPRRRPGSNRA